MSVQYQTAPATQASEYIRLRGLTRENAASVARLRELGVTAQSWAADIESGVLVGTMAQVDGRIVGYCFGNARSGEVVVLVVLPDFEGLGLGRHLLALVTQTLRDLGHQRLFLGCSSDPAVRSYGFYRRLGWRSTGAMDARGDEILELVRP